MGMFEQKNTTAAAASLHGAEQAGSASSHDEHVIVGLGLARQHPSVRRGYGRRARLRVGRGSVAGPDLGRRAGF